MLLKLRRLIWLGLFMSILIPFSASAITVGPTKIEINADPGAIVNDQLIVMNEGTETQTFYPVFEKFIEVNGERQFIPGSETEVAHWIHGLDSVTLAPQERKEVPFSFNIPKNAPPGGHFAVIWWSTAPPDSNQPLAVVTRAGILVYVRVAGQIVESGDVKTFAPAGEKSFYEHIPTDFVVNFDNRGNVHLKPSGEIRLTNIFGQTKVIFVVNDVGITVLPNSDKILRTSLKTKKLPFAIGLYKATLELRYGDQPETLNKELTLYLFPWKEISIGVVVLALLLLLLTKGVSTYNRWIVRKYAKMHRS